MTEPAAEAAVPVAPPDGSADAGIPWHYGDPLREQRLLSSGQAVVDISNRGVVTVAGPDRLTWLHDLTSQGLKALAQRSMQLQATVQEGVLMIGDGSHNVDIEPLRWK